MAKREKIEAEDIKNETSIEETITDTATVEEPEIRITTGVKNVRIHTVEEINSIISCVPYTFAKDKDVMVPSDVAAILCYAKKAYRL